MEEQARSQEAKKKNVFLFPTLNMFLFGSNQPFRRHSKRKSLLLEMEERELQRFSNSSFCDGSESKLFRPEPHVGVL